MTDKRRPPCVEDAYWHMNDVTTQQQKKRIATWGAAYILLSAFVLPLLFAFVLPLFAR